ncbi:hypothetical protein [Sphingosinicella terrae]|uniref:hypothetical protein n=1 Tax=Sphingosinicella terrae TaxID=2172047 RepID=UPI000E0CC5C2|nr:hypothetical protein [Sphingosinicella terrae]
MRIIIPRDAPTWASSLVREIEQQMRRPADAPVRLPSFTLADLPAAADWPQGLIHVPDEAGGPVVAFSDGTNWRRVTDRAVVS